MVTYRVLIYPSLVPGTMIAEPVGLLSRRGRGNNPEEAESDLVRILRTLPNNDPNAPTHLSFKGQQYLDSLDNTIEPHKELRINDKVTLQFYVFNTTHQFNQFPQYT